MFLMLEEFLVTHFLWNTNVTCLLLQILLASDVREIEAMNFVALTCIKFLDIENL